MVCFRDCRTKNFNDVYASVNTTSQRNHMREQCNQSWDRKHQTSINVSLTVKITGRCCLYRAHTADKKLASVTIAFINPAKPAAASGLLPGALEGEDEDGEDDGAGRNLEGGNQGSNSNHDLLGADSNPIVIENPKKRKINQKKKVMYQSGSTQHHQRSKLHRFLEMSLYQMERFLNIGIFIIISIRPPLKNFVTSLS